ncbi:PREDICTED: uncharacterized protein LOC109208924 [Nicotiana attenuata]|uniref:Stress response protein nst1 n=1 Tax=Nicotiana attenuata TaxID=49451 RepID=A0A314KR76_NICAT|nr:PREDICTED: uncharacterized protein LOC109208924 [Nicotiana attenuata]OIT31259.1 hypothetical protein A4A49_33327 [Nicotiana attenuata]
MPGLAQRNDHQLGGSDSGNGFWSKHNDGIGHNELQKFWSELSPQERQELLRIDKQILFEQARKHMYCSRCNGLLLEGFLQIVMYGKSLQQEGARANHPSGRVRALKNQCDGGLCVKTGYEDDAQDPSVHPWGGLTTTRDGALTLLDCYIYTKSLEGLQNVFDSARARERERELLYPDACGGGGRGWISHGMTSYGRGHGTRETCALHTARLSVDTLVDFWSALGEETRQSLLRMKEEDFIERLLYRFDSKRFCRDCRKNVIREFKELKELKRMRREPRCTSWFCVADTAFQYEVSNDTIHADWHQTFIDNFGTYHHFEWAVGTGEGKCDILDYENVGLSGRVQVNGLDLGGLNACYITLRAWKMDGRCTELSVKAHALKGQQCVHCRLVVGEGFVTITRGESIRRFFEHAEEAEEEEDDNSMDKDGNDLDGECSRPQKHAKSPELAREFLLDAATVIFKEQVEKAFREGTARQNAHNIFVCLALKLLEERVHVACKEIITLEKQMKLLEEEEKEKREEEERKERRRTKEKEKKLRRKERLREKEKDREKKGCESNETNFVPDDSKEEIWRKERLREKENDIEKKSCEPNQTDDVPKEESTPSVDDDESNLISKRGSVSETGEVNRSSPLSPLSPDNEYDLLLDRYHRSNMQIHSDDYPEEFNIKDMSSSVSDHLRYSRRRSKFRNDSQPDSGLKWFDRRRFAVVSESGGVVSKHDPRHYCDDFGASKSTNRLNKQLRNNVAKSNIHNGTSKFAEKLQCSNNKRMNDRYDSAACSCNQHTDYRSKLDPNMAREIHDNKPVSKSASSSDISKQYYHGNKYNQLEYMRESGRRLKNRMTTGNNLSSWDSPVTKKVWEPTESQKKYPRNSSDSDLTLSTETLEDPEYSISNSSEVSSPLQIHHEEKDVQESRKPGSKTESNCRTGFHLEEKSQHYLKYLGGDDENESLQGSSLVSSQRNSSNSDNCSSCLSEGDSNTSFSNPRHPESSSTSDSEDCSQKSEGRGTSEIRNGFADCYEVAQQKGNATGSGVHVECLTPDAARTTTVQSFPVTANSTCSSGNMNGASLGTQPQPVHPPVQNQGIHFPLFQAPAMGYYYQSPASWGVAPANGLMPFPHPNHYVFASPFAYGLNAYTHFMQYGGLQHLTPPVVNPGQFPVYQSVAQTNDTCTKKSANDTTIGGLKDAHHKANMQRMGQHTTDKPTVEAGQNEKSGSSGFSLFSFTPDPFSLKQGIARNISSDLTADHTEGDGGCIKKDPVEEYNPFANRIEFPFPDIVC